jgi:hypothetical protein
MASYGSQAFAGADEPELLAIRALGFVTSARSGLRRLAQQSQIAESELMRRPIAAEHLAPILDFVIKDEALLDAFAGAVGVPLESVYEARRLLRPAAGFAGATVIPSQSPGLRRTA